MVGATLAVALEAKLSLPAIIHKPGRACPRHGNMVMIQYRGSIVFVDKIGDTA